MGGRRRLLATPRRDKRFGLSGVKCVSRGEAVGYQEGLLHPEILFLAALNLPQIPV